MLNWCRANMSFCAFLTSTLTGDTMLYQKIQKITHFYDSKNLNKELKKVLDWLMVNKRKIFFNQKYASTCKNIIF